jgi:DNA-binding transcriptional MocR family regulator
MGLEKNQSVNGFFRALGLEPARVPRQRPMYRVLVDLVERGLAHGAFGPGDQLPPERDLARAIRISRATVVRAYGELESRGLVRGYVGRGTFVSASPDAGAAPFAWRGKVARAALQASDSTVRDLMRLVADPEVLSFAAGAPALDVFPVAAFQQTVTRAIGRDASIWKNGPTEGLLRCRTAIADRFGGTPDEVIVVSGAQQGMDLLSRCLIDPGDTVVVDRPTYLGAIQSFRSAGARFVAWDTRRADPDELEELLLRYRPKLVYLNPTFQNPTGLTLPARVRREVVALAARYRVPLVEDGAYGELSLGAAPPASFLALDERREIVIHLNTFSKTLAPGLRVGWITAARPIVEQLALVKQRVDLHTQNLAQVAVADFLESGGFDAHLVRLRKEHLRRRDAMVAALRAHVPAKAMRFAVPDGGLYIWGRLATTISARAVQHAAAARGVAIVTGEPFYMDGGGTHELRICFTAQPAEHAVKAAEAIAHGIAHADALPARAVPLMPMA